MEITVAVAAGLDHGIAEMEMGDIGTQGPDNKLARLIGRGKMAQVYQQAEVVMGGAHICGELCGIGRRTNQRRLIHIVVKNLQLHHHALGCRIVADIPGGLQQLGICLLLGFLLPFTRQERNAPRAEILRLVHRFDQRCLRLFPSLFVNIVGVELGTQQTGLCAIADLEMALVQDCLCFCILSAIALELNGIEKVVLCNCL